MSVTKTSRCPLLTLLYLGLFVLSGCSGSDTPAFDSSTAQLLQSTLDGSVGRIGVPGAAMIVMRPDGARWVGVSGLADIEHSTPMAANLKFRVGSLTKTFTAVMILQLVQEGRLSLDDRLASLLPGLIPNGAQISVRQLLNHTSGLFDYAQAENPNFLDELLAHPLRQWTKEELMAIANANGPYFPPGTEFHYSNTNYVLLGMIIEKVSGKTYAEEAASRLLVPLGLKNTSVPDTPDVPEGSTQGYTWQNNAWANTTGFDTSWAFGTGSIISTSGDLLVWLDALMKGTLLDQERRAEMFTFVATIAPGYGYGLGLEKQEFDAIGHTGDFVYGGQAAMYDYQGWRFIVLVNASPSDQSIAFGSETIMYRTMRALGIW